MRFVRLLVVLALLLLGAAACGGSDEGADDAEESEFTIQTDDGDVSVSGGSGEGDVTIDLEDGELEICGSQDGDEASIIVESEDGTATISGGDSVPDGFPVSIHPDCSVVSSTTIESPDGEMMMVTLEMSADKAEEVAEFYEEACEALGMMVMRTTGTNPDGSMIFITAVDDEDGDQGASCMMSIEAEKATAVISIGGDT